MRASNLADGRAFEFNANGGTEVGAHHRPGRRAAPFTTTATGVATGLNADKVDGKDATDIVAQARTFADGQPRTARSAAERGATETAARAPRASTASTSTPTSASAPAPRPITGDDARAIATSTLADARHGARAHVRQRGRHRRPTASFHLVVTC